MSLRGIIWRSSSFTWKKAARRYRRMLLDAQLDHAGEQFDHRETYRDLLALLHIVDALRRGEHPQGHEIEQDEMRRESIEWLAEEWEPHHKRGPDKDDEKPW